MKKLYEYEISRTDVTPNEFYKYCEKALMRKGIDMEAWVTYDMWTETCQYNTQNNTQNKEEIVKMNPYDFQMFYINAYNVILSFDFYDDKKGFGYLYIIEYER